MKIILLSISKLAFIILFVITSSYNLNAQENYKQSSKEVIKLINESQSYYSADDELINGCVYPLPNSRRKGNPYYHDNWTEATIFVGNKKYPNLLIKFDLVLGDVILKADIESEVPKLINLNKFQVDSFLMGNSLFVNSRNLHLEKSSINIIKSLNLSLNKANVSVSVSDSNITQEEKNHIYLEQIYKGKYSLYKEYKKIFIKEYNNITPYGKYSSLKTEIYLIKNNYQYNVNRKSTFIKNFGKEKQNEIKSYMKRNNINYSKASQQELKQLMIFCTKTSSN